MVGTAIVASVAFGYCGSDSITGPEGGSGPAGTISADGSGGGDGDIEVTPFPVTPDEIPTTLASTEVPTTMQATACNGDVVNWEDARTKAGGVSYFNTTKGTMRVVIRIRQIAKGRGTRYLTDPTFPKRWYYGYQEYEKETFFALGVSEVEEEFELLITAKGEKETRMFQDDYKLRLRVVIRVSNGNLTIRSSTHEKCY